MKWTTLLWITVLLFAGAAFGQNPHAMHAPVHGAADGPKVARDFEWKADAPDAVDAFGRIPVMDLGRVKPMEVYGGLRMLMLNGKRKLELANGETQGPAEWTLDVIFFPDASRNTPFIRIENDEVLSTVGLDTGEHRKRDWYTYNELFPARTLIAQRAEAISQKDKADQSPVERQLLKLGLDLDNLESMLGMLDPLRVDYDVSASPRLVEIFTDGKVDNVLDVLDHRPGIAALMTEDGAEADAAQQLLSDAFTAIERSKVMGGWGPGFVPPVEGMQTGEAWWRVRDLSDLAMLDFGETEFDIDEGLKTLRLLDKVEDAKRDPVAFTAAVEELLAHQEALTADSDLPMHIGAEVHLYRFKPFINALVLFLLGFIVMLLASVAKGGKWGDWVGWTTGSLAMLLLVWGIVLRCVVRERPPVVTLYDTILFVTAIAVGACLVTEWITRMRVALGTGLVLGVIGMFLASSYEVVEVQSAGDTMATVVAVLDTNYYLAIHVTTIAMGYSGGLFAGALAHVWLLGKLFGLRRGDGKFYRGLARMVYGVLCFSLFFSLFGTVMGGVWANDSWGRFWGWDPKENGALLICIWLLLTVHLRLGGYIRDRGVCCMAIGAGMVVAASWWGVNLLNVGLHSYGFTSGVAKFLYIFWGSQGLVLVLSLGDYLSSKTNSPATS